MLMKDIRARLHMKAEVYGDKELHELAEATRRRRRTVKTPPKSTKMTPQLRAKIRAFKKANPDASQFEIGQVFKVNQARVSEALIGKKQ